MPRRYTPDFKALVVDTMHRNKGNIALTSQQTGIPPRTLYDWLREHPIPPPPQPLPPAVVAENEDENVERLRQTLIADALHLANSLSDDIYTAPLHQRALALSHIIDRIVKLQAVSPKQQVLHIVYEDPEDDPFYKVSLRDDDGIEEEDDSYWNPPSLIENDDPR